MQLSPNSFAAGCESCPESSMSAIMVTVQSLSRALREGKPILHVRRLTGSESARHVGKGAFNVEVIRDLPQDYRLNDFEVLGSINRKETTKYVFFPSRTRIMIMPSALNPSGISYLPKKNSEWIFIDPKLDENAEGFEGYIKSKDFVQIKVEESTRGIVPISVDNNLEVNTENLFEDIKAISEFMKLSDAKQLPKLKSPLGKEVLRNIMNPDDDLLKDKAQDIKEAVENILKSEAKGDAVKETVDTVKKTVEEKAKEATGEKPVTTPKP